MNSSSPNKSKPKSKTKIPYFIEEDNGLASLAEEIKLGNSSSCNNNNYMALHRKRSSSLKNIASLHTLPSSRNENHHQNQQSTQPHFLDACFLCRKLLGNKDIFMYRGDTPFCSEECRQKQIEMDEAKEKRWNISTSMKALRKKEQKKSTSPNKTSQNCTIRTSTLAAA